MPEPRTVCIVDDDADVREALRLVLEQHGYDVLEAEDGEDALAALTAARERCALVLLDLVMPAVDGVEFRKKQLCDAKLAQIPVAVVSGATRAAEQARELLADGFIEKPFDIAELLALIAALANGRVSVRP